MLDKDGLRTWIGGVLLGRGLDRWHLGCIVLCRMFGGSRSGFLILVFVTFLGIFFRGFLVGRMRKFGDVLSSPFFIE